MPAGAVDFNTRAIQDSTATNSFTVPLSAFKEGVNTVQVEMHRFEELAGGDLRFDLQLRANAVTTYNSFRLISFCQTGPIRLFLPACTGVQRL